MERGTVNIKGDNVWLHNKMCELKGGGYDRMCVLRGRACERVSE